MTDSRLLASHAHRPICFDRVFLLLLHSELIAQNDAQDEGRHGVAVLLGARRDRPYRGLIAVLHRPSQREGHQVLRELPYQRDWPLEKNVDEVSRRLDRRAVVERAARVEGDAVLSNTPPPRHIEVVESESNGIDETVARGAGGVLS